MMEQDFSIMINIPKTWFDTYDGGVKTYLRVMMSIVDSGQSPWYNAISLIPKQKVVYCYIVFDGKVQLRANIAGFLKKGEKGNLLGNRNCCLLTGPVIKAPMKIEQKGFRGFRYCKQLF